MALTNPLTIALHWFWFLCFATLLGVLALRIWRYEVHSWPLACSLGAVGLVLGKHWFPHGFWNAWFLTTSWEHHLIPGLLWALAVLGLYRAFHWWTEVGAERWDRAAERDRRDSQRPRT